MDVFMAQLCSCNVECVMLRLKKASFHLLFFPTFLCFFKMARYSERIELQGILEVNTSIICCNYTS